MRDALAPVVIEQNRHSPQLFFGVDVEQLGGTIIEQLAGLFEVEG